MTAEKAVVRGERGGVRRLEHKMLRRGDESGLAACVAAPEQENDRLFVIVQLFDDMVGERRPAEIFVAVRLSGAGR